MADYSDTKNSKDEKTKDLKNAVSNDPSNAITLQDLARILKTLNSTENSDAITLEELRNKLNADLTALEALSVAFPECSDVMLSLIKSQNAAINPKNGRPQDEITSYFDEYFTFRRHQTIATNLSGILDSDLTGCISSAGRPGEVFPPQWCLPAPCVTLEGDRRTFENDGQTFFIKRLFIADLVWLFYFDRMGIFKILGAILDDYAIKGKLPISNGSVNAPGAENKDDLITIVLEAMTRKTKMGISSTVRDRNITYRRALGWIQEEGRKLNLETVVNTAFTNLFHKFIQTALEYYKDKRLATAIQASTSVNRVSVATLTSIKDTIDLLVRAFDPFKYGRLYSNTLSGIVWVIAGMALVRDLRTTLGIPSEYKDPDEFIPAAYDILIAKRAITPSETNRYDVHRDCAENARAILLDLEVLDYENTDPGKDLEVWLDLIEGRIEGYRTAYRSLTGVDLGEPGTPRIEQQV
jgi:hypothetical protein